jgi:predicted cupin superfamily sugar epimerase
MDLRDTGLAAEAVAAALQLAPHPEGGFYRETFRDGDLARRGAATAILFLLPQGVISHWHRVDALEIWVWQAGAPLLLEIAAPDAAAAGDRLGPDLAAGELLQRTVPVQHWQRCLEPRHLHRRPCLPVFRIRHGSARLAAQFRLSPA